MTNPTLLKTSTEEEGDEGVVIQPIPRKKGVPLPSRYRGRGGWGWGWGGGGVIQPSPGDESVIVEASGW